MYIKVQILITCKIKVALKKKSKPDVVDYNTNRTTRNTALSNFKPPKYRHDHDRHRCK